MRSNEESKKLEHRSLDQCADGTGRRRREMIGRGERNLTPASRRGAEPTCSAGFVRQKSKMAVPLPD
jgi:hypothetical protein